MTDKEPRLIRGLTALTTEDYQALLRERDELRDEVERLRAKAYAAMLRDFETKRLRAAIADISKTLDEYERDRMYAYALRKIRRLIERLA